MISLIKALDLHEWVPYVYNEWECGPLPPLSAAPEHDNCIAKMIELKCRTYVCCSGQRTLRRLRSCRRRKVLPTY